MIGTLSTQRHLPLCFPNWRDPGHHRSSKISLFGSSWKNISTHHISFDRLVMKGGGWNEDLIWNLKFGWFPKKININWKPEYLHSFSGLGIWMNEWLIAFSPFPQKPGAGQIKSSSFSIVRVPCKQWPWPRAGSLCLGICLPAAGTWKMIHNWRMNESKTVSKD